MKQNIPVAARVGGDQAAACTEPVCQRRGAGRLLAFWLVAWLLGALGAQAQVQTFTHPSIPFTNDDLNQLRANITRQPWQAGCAALQSDARSQLSYVMQGPFATVSRVPNLDNAQWISDMVAIHNLTFRYVFTNNAAYARKATDMLDAWAVTNTTWGGGENQLDIGDYTPYFVTAVVAHGSPSRGVHGAPANASRHYHQAPHHRVSAPAAVLPLGRWAGRITCLETTKTPACQRAFCVVVSA